MEKPVMTGENVKTLLDTKYIRVYDLQYAPGKHYYDASRHSPAELSALKKDMSAMLPDAVSCFVIVRTPGCEPRLLLAYEYRYTVGEFLLSPPAGLLDPEDRLQPEPQLSAARREIAEETGIQLKDTDRLFTVSPLAFSTPGMTDEANGLACAVADLPDLSCLSQAGAVGSELFDGFCLVTRAEATDLFRTGKDARGHYFSIFTWAALSWFLSGLWEE